MSDLRHAQMSAAIVDWLGDAVGDYARALLAGDMADLDRALDDVGLQVVDVNSSDGRGEPWWRPRSQRGRVVGSIPASATPPVSSAPGGGS